MPSIISGIDFDDNSLGPQLLDVLLTDRTTGKHLRWCTDDYSLLGEGYRPEDHITMESLKINGEALVHPRVIKTDDTRLKRTHDSAEVFTPSWICNAQNNAVDEAWFGYPNVFNTPQGMGWDATYEEVSFPEDRTWHDYVDACILEVCCGEAPYLASRYDAATGQAIPLYQRIGMLDRKLRVVNENAASDEEWLKWARRAVESIYGYDYQGDNVLLSRRNILATYCDYHANWFRCAPDKERLAEICEVISWNIWQMDGQDNTVPYEFTTISAIEELTLWDDDEPEQLQLAPVKSHIFDWRHWSEEEFDNKS